MFKRRCYCMNNSYNNNCKLQDDIIENKCKDVVSYEDYYDSCGCGFDEDKSIFPENPMLAQSYVPYQYVGKTFIPSVGLKMGTIFPELVSPYVPCQSMEEYEYLKRTNEIGKGCNKCQ